LKFRNHKEVGKSEKKRTLYRTLNSGDRHFVYRLRGSLSRAVPFSCSFPGAVSLSISVPFTQPCPVALAITVAARPSYSLDHADGFCRC